MFVAGPLVTAGGAIEVVSGGAVAGGAAGVATVDVIATELDWDEVLPLDADGDFPVAISLAMDRAETFFLLVGLTADPMAPIEISTARTALGMMKTLRWYHWRLPRSVDPSRRFGAEGIVGNPVEEGGPGVGAGYVCSVHARPSQ